MWIFSKSLGVICYDRWVLQRVTKITWGICVSWRNWQPTFLIHTLFLNQWNAHNIKSTKTRYLESRNSLKLSFTSFRGHCLNFVRCESFLESNSNDILALCDKNWEDPVNSSNFSVRAIFFYFKTISIIHMHGLAVYVKEGFPFPWELFLENSEGIIYVFDSLHFIHCPTSMSFFLLFVHGFSICFI